MAILAEEQLRAEEAKKQAEEDRNSSCWPHRALCGGLGGGFIVIQCMVNQPTVVFPSSPGMSASVVTASPGGRASGRGELQGQSR